MRSPALADGKVIPDEFLSAMMQVLGVKNYSANGDYSGPYLKPVVARIYPLFILLYAIPAALGLTLNVLIIVYITKYKLYRDVTHAFLVNLAVCHCVQCAFVLPITLMVMLIHNWVFGQFLCFFLPLLQDIPLHVAMLSHLLIAWDRKRWLTDPLKVRLPAFVCSCASWLAGLVIALPYPIYTTYLDLEYYLPNFAGVGICAVNLVDDMQEYMRGLFVIMYCAPMTLLGYLYIRTSRELRPPDGPLSIMMFEARAEARSRQIRLSTGGRGAATSEGTRDGNGEQGAGTASTTSATAAAQANQAGNARTYDLYDAEADVNREKRTQRHLGAMASSQVLCVCPLMILRLARMTVAETYENQAHYDITFLMFVWIAFLPTIIVPWMYASWVLSKPTKERLRGYLRLSSRRNTNVRSEQSLDESGEVMSGSHRKKPLTSSATPLATVIPLKPSALASPHRRTASGRSSHRLSDAANSGSGTATTSMSEPTKSPAGNSARTVETTISRQSSVGRPRRQLPPPLRIEDSNFHKTPSVKSSRTLASSAHNSSIRSTTSRTSSAAPLYARRYSAHSRRPSYASQPARGEDEDDVGSLVGNSSDITSSTYCGTATEGSYQDDPLGATTRRPHGGPLPGPLVVPFRRRGSTLTQPTTHPTGPEVDDDEESEIFSSVSQPSARKRPVGILKATPSILSISESEYSSRKGSFSTLSRDLEIIDQLERERSMDIQEMIQREKSYEQYLVRQNSKHKFSTNFDEYFEAAAAAASLADPGPPSHLGGGAQLPPPPPGAGQLPAPSPETGTLSPRRSRSPMHRRPSQLPAIPITHSPGERPLAFGPRRSIELDKRFHRTYSTSGSTRSSTKSRERITFQDDV
ncbi:G-protein coupled receptor moody [Anopheles nili]|uniref:G-protein coupled receptor moody n=1 Tax=Anopheles nili TaxID=185578 RepID=UPI00237BE594|nr:G-protein coupled receptor moody [Anopheles nili]